MKGLSADLENLQIDYCYFSGGGGVETKQKPDFYFVKLLLEDNNLILLKQ